MGGLFPTVDEGVKLAESTIDALRSWVKMNGASLEIVFYICDEPAEKKKTKKVDPHFHILLLGNPALKIVSALEEYVGNKIKKDCHLYAVEAYDVDSLLMYIRPQCKKIRSMALDHKCLPYFEASKLKRSNYRLVEDDIRKFTSKFLTSEVSEDRNIEMSTIWDTIVGTEKFRYCEADLSWLDEPF